MSSEVIELLDDQFPIVFKAPKAIIVPIAIKIPIFTKVPIVFKAFIFPVQLSNYPNSHL